MTTKPEPLDVRALRDRLGLTGQALAALINARIPGANANRQTVWRWEHGTPPSPIYAAAIRALVTDLVTNHDEPEPTISDR